MTCLGHVTFWITFGEMRMDSSLITFFFVYYELERIFNKYFYTYICSKTPIR